MTEVEGIVLSQTLVWPFLMLLLLTQKVLFANLLSQDYSLSKSCISFVFTDTRKPRDYLLHLVLDAIAGDFSHLLSSQ